MAVTASARKQSSSSTLKKPQHHYFTLLTTELLFILGYPFLTGTAFRLAVFRTLALIMLAAALYAVLERGKLTVIAFILGIPAILVHIANVAGFLLSVDIVALILGAVFLAFVTGVFIWSIVSDPTVTAETLAGAISAYLLIGIVFGLAYMLVDRLVPGSFRNVVEQGRHVIQPEFVFFSFITLTTVGYGDIIPWSAHARSLVMIESVIGIMYPAVLIGSLIGARGRKPTDS